MPRFSDAIGLILFTLLSFGCDRANSLNNSAENVDSHLSPIVRGNWYKPPVFASWQWQLQGEVNLTYDVELYDLDLFDSSATLIKQLQEKDTKVICYFSAGSYEQWRPDAAQFTARDLGNSLDGWAEEQWLDIRSDSVRSIIKSRLNLAVEKGCDGVEPDNMDGYLNNSGFDLSFKDQLAFNRWVANQAHLRNLAVGLKNDLEQINDLVAYYDFAVNEQCFEYSECNFLTPFINNSKPILNAEYEQKYINNSLARNNLCVQSLNLNFSTLILPLDLDDEFRYSCLKNGVRQTK